MRQLLMAVTAACLAACAGSAPRSSAQPAPTMAPPVELTAQQDHQRLMGLLGITSLRPGPSGDPNAPNARTWTSPKLVALCTPRPVFISVGSQAVEGGWVDAKGMFLAGVAAGPVYRLLGRKDLGTTEFPPQQTA